MRFPARSASALAGVFLGVAPIDAQMPSPTSTPRRSPLRSGALSSIRSARLRQHYVDADTGAMIAKAHDRSPPARTIPSRAGRFAEALTVDMRSVNDDRHLNVMPIPVVLELDLARKV
jgi:hypothetical protein